MSNPLLQEKKKKRTADKEMREALGDEAPPKLVPNTTESLRVEDETIVDPEDEEVGYYLKYLGVIWGAGPSPQRGPKAEGGWGHLPNLSLTPLKSHCGITRYAVCLF